MIDYSRIPEDTIETLTAWIKSGRPMGHFCEAVVSNNLRQACARADEGNRHALFEIVVWLYNNAPIGSWGSPEVLKRWPEWLARVRAIEREAIERKEQGQVSE